MFKAVVRKEAARQSVIQPLNPYGKCFKGEWGFFVLHQPPLTCIPKIRWHIIAERVSIMNSVMLTIYDKGHPMKSVLPKMVLGQNALLALCNLISKILNPSKGLYCLVSCPISYYGSLHNFC
jgi:hypothetical protein